MIQRINFRIVALDDGWNADFQQFRNVITAQLGTGYTIAYLVYTIGTLILAPASLNIVGAIAGLTIVVIFVAILGLLIAKANSNVKKEFALNSRK